MGKMSEGDPRPEAEAESGYVPEKSNNPPDSSGRSPDRSDTLPDTELLQDGEAEDGESIEEVRKLIAGDQILALERRIAFLEARLDIEVAEVRRAVVRSTELLMEVLRQEIRDLASRIEAGTPRHTEATERFWALAALDEGEEN